MSVSSSIFPRDRARRSQHVTSSNHHLKIYFNICCDYWTTSMSLSAQKLFNYWFSNCVNHEITRFNPFSRKYSIQIRQKRVKLLHDSTLNNSLPQQMCFQLRSFLVKAKHQRAINQTLLSNSTKKLMPRVVKAFLREHKCGSTSNESHLVISKEENWVDLFVLISSLSAQPP